MARRKAKAGPTLDELIPVYGSNKEKLDELDKVCKEENKQIKELLGDKSSHEADGWKVVKSVQNRDKMDEDLLCAKLSAFPEMYEAGIIKVQEYVDMTALEDAMYKNQLSKKMLEAVESCREHKEVVTLRVSRVKERDEE
jgi:hypothetical protein